MSALLHRLRDWLAEMIDVFAPAKGAPPRSLWPFIRWCLSGTWPVIWLATLFSALAGAMEVISAWLLGVVIDSALAHGPVDYFADNALLIAVYVGFFLLVRPFLFGAAAAFNGIVIPPNVAPLIQSRLHRWSLGHAIGFFDNDFA